MRKAIHIVTAFIILWVSHSTSRSVIIAILITISILFGIFELVRLQAKPIGRKIHNNIKYLLRTEEKNSSVNKLHFTGATWVCWSLTILTLLYPIPIVASTIIGFLFADAMAAIVGRAIGKHFWPGSKKTIEGSIAFFCTGLVIMSMYPELDWRAVGITVLIGTIVEIPQKPFNDNFRVPMVTATALFILERLFG